MIMKKTRAEYVCFFQTLTLPFPCLTRYNEHRLHGLTRMMFIEKNKKEPLIGGCSASNVICADIHL